jgi:drug/metabolite transporter (DMT)-like permease
LDFQKDHEGFKTPRYLGYVFQVTTVLLSCLQLMVSKLLFDALPALTPFSLLLLQSITSALVFTALLNKELSCYLVCRGKSTLIGFRVALGFLIVACVYTAVKYLPLVIVSLVSNLGPLLTAVFSWFILN